MLDDILKNVVDSQRGLRALVLVDRDGMLVSVAGQVGNGALEVLAASYTDIARRVESIHGEAELQAPAELTAMGPEGTVLHHQVTPDYGVIAVLDPDATLGRIRYEIRKIAGRLIPELAT